ncbi:hypothetical protein MMC29_003898 [Sticta canariensis]|nr:hypothetical protein [Sticta canariensis]
MSSAIAAASTTITYLDRTAFLASTYTVADPPPGVTANFDAPNTNGTVFIVVLVLGLIVTTIITAMRLWTKGYLIHTSGWDDCCYLRLVGLIIEESADGWGGHTWNFRTTIAKLEKHYKFAFASDNAYVVGIGSVKVSILLMYLRTFTGSRSFRYTIWVLLFLVIASHVVGFLIYAASVSPVSCIWIEYQTDEEAESHCRENWSDEVIIGYLTFLNAFTIALDLVILYLPCRPVWRLHLPKRQRIAIMMIILAGIIVTIASITRLVYLINRFYGNDHDDSLTEFQVNMISTIELDVALVCCCLPTLKPFIRRYLPTRFRLTNFASESNNHSAPAASLTAHPNKSGRKWASGYRNEELLAASYLELGEDGKSDQSYTMTVLPVEEQK